MSVEVIKTSMRDMFAMPEFESLRDEYIAECAMDGIPRQLPRLEAYEQIESAGILTLLCAFSGGVLVGFATLIAAPILHYSIPMLATESIFVGSDHRKTGAGLTLLRAAEDHARQNGIHLMQVSAPAGSRLERVMPRQGYDHTNTIFTKRFVHE